MVAALTPLMAPATVSSPAGDFALKYQFLLLPNPQRKSIKAKSKN